MKTNRIYLFIAISLCYMYAHAQQDVTFTLYNYNMNIINPAYAGVGEKTELTLNFRSQWIGLEDGPETQSFSLGVPMNEKVGLGVSVVNSSVFVLGETDVFFDFSYRLQLAETLDLFLGLKAGGSYVNIKLSDTGISDDPLFTENVSVFNPNIGAGAYLRGKSFYVNVSAPSVLKSKRYEKQGGVATQATDKLQFFAGAGYHIPFSEDIIFTPSFLTRTISDVPFSMDISGTIDLYDKVEVGMSYRLKESISSLAFFKAADWINIGYAYDASTTEVANYSKGNHEVILKFRF